MGIFASVTRPLNQFFGWGLGTRLVENYNFRVKIASICTLWEEDSEVLIQQPGSDCVFSAATKQQTIVYRHSMKLCCYDCEFHYMWAASLQSCQNQNAWKRRVLGRCLHMQLLPATVSIQITYISRVSIKACANAHQIYVRFCMV